MASAPEKKIAIAEIPASSRMTKMQLLSQWLVARGCNASVRERALKARTNRPTRKEFCDTICQKLLNRRAPRRGSSLTSTS
jgi:hypothetical protein